MLRKENIFYITAMLIKKTNMAFQKYLGTFLHTLLMRVDKHRNTQTISRNENNLNLPLSQISSNPPQPITDNGRQFCNGLVNSSRFPNLLDHCTQDFALSLHPTSGAKCYLQEFINFGQSCWNFLWHVGKMFPSGTLYNALYFFF